MARRFQIGELRTLVARALQEGEYAPAASARVRAVPDTRTIRYYTTLGLINPPAELRGRIAYYDETHLMQIVAIKQLQSQEKSLSDIQQRLVGLTPRKLEAIAKLPADFWKAADKYLATKPNTTHSPASASLLATAEVASAVTETDAAGASREHESFFWLEPAALPTMPDLKQRSADVATCATVAAETLAVIRLTMPDGFSLTIELPRTTRLTKQLDVQSLISAAQPLTKELRKQNLLID
jgi:DNA-binding transcriptional MerR regulator